MRPWTTGRRGRCTWQRDGVWWCESRRSRAQQMENSRCTHSGGCASAAARDLGRVSRAAGPLYLRNHVSWSSQMGPPILPVLFSIHGKSNTAFRPGWCGPGSSNGIPDWILISDSLERNKTHLSSPSIARRFFFGQGKARPPRRPSCLLTLQSSSRKRRQWES